MIEVFYTLAITAMACGILGPILVMRRLSMTADALSHSVLLGIVLAFLVILRVDSIYLKLSAALFGLLTVLLVEFISNKSKIKKDDSLAIVFPVFFALAVILITRFCRNAHLDVEIVLMGNPLFAPFIRMFNMPKSMFLMGIMFIINLLFIIIKHREISMVCFDEEFAKMQDINLTLLYTIFMTLVSLTAVLAFDSVGGILVISFLIAPAAAACLFTKNFNNTIILTLLIGVLSSFLGYYFGIRYNVSLSGMSAVSSMVIVLISIFINPNGIIKQWIKNKIQKEEILGEMILIHMYQHNNNGIELGFSTIHKHLNWREEDTKKRIDKLIDKGLIERITDKNMYSLTSKGLFYTKKLLNRV